MVKIVLKHVIWPKEVTLISRTQPSGPLCLWQCFNTLRTAGKICLPDSLILNCIFDNNGLTSCGIVWFFLRLGGEVISNIFLVIFHSRDKKCSSPWSFPLSAGPIRHGAFCPSVYKWIFHDRLSFSVEGDDEDGDHDKDPSHFDEYF